MSHTTVSLALRNSPRITPSVRKQVQKAARQAGYHADPTVSNLMARLRTIGTTAVRETLGFTTAWPTRNGWRNAPNHVRFFDGAPAACSAANRANKRTMMTRVRFMSDSLRYWRGSALALLSSGCQFRISNS